MLELRMFCWFRAGVRAAVGNAGQDLSWYPVTAVSERWLVENGIAINRLSRQFKEEIANKLHFPNY
jgi:hypothetical protein